MSKAKPKVETSPTWLKSLRESVSALELTRLAREAASALEYLAAMRYVHRDVRAANCLVDHKRTLKLADFGMARKTDSHLQGPTSEPDDYKYICTRRGMFPVPWMAPESVLHGVFTSSSDVWALGVLMLEIATLGGRPFGKWRSPEVLKFVREGGHPPFPTDISYHLCDLLETCWAIAPEKRPTASSVREYLTTYSSAVRPAVLPALAEESDDQGDSGFGERDPHNTHL